MASEVRLILSNVGGGWIGKGAACGRGKIKRVGDMSTRLDLFTSQCMRARLMHILHTACIILTQGGPRLFPIRIVRIEISLGAGYICTL
jgi:hypothetical protein